MTTHPQQQQQNLYKSAKTPDLFEFFEEEILPNISLSDLYPGVEFKGGGGKVVRGDHCPFCGEKKRAFVVFNDGKNYHCHSCGPGHPLRALNNGEVIEGKRWRELIEQCASKLGKKVPEQARELSPEALRRIDRFARRREALAEIARICREALEDPAVGAAARSYLEERGVGDDATREEWELGYYPHKRYVWERLREDLREPGREMGAFDSPSYENDNRIVYFWRDRNRQPLNLYFRHCPRKLDEETGEIYRIPDAKDEGKEKRTHSLPGELSKASPYGMHKVRPIPREELSVVVAEGPADVIALHKAGVKNPIAWVSAQPSKEQEECLVKRNVKRVILVGDSDREGVLKGIIATSRRLSKRGVETFVAEEFPVRPDGKKEDPNSYLAKAKTDKEREALQQDVRRRVAEAESFATWQGKRLARLADAAQTDKELSDIRSETRKELAHFIDPSQKAHFAKLVAPALSITPEELLRLPPEVTFHDAQEVDFEEKGASLQGESWETSPPIPLDNPPPPPPAPVESFPIVAQRLIAATSAHTQMEEGYAMSAALGAASAAVLNSVRVRVKGKWKEPGILWIVTGGRPSERKSPCQRVVFHALEKRQAERAAKLNHTSLSAQARVSARMNRVKEFEKELEKLLADTKINDDARRIKEEAIAKKIDQCEKEIEALKPLPLEFASDITSEAIPDMMFENDGKARIIAEEGRVLQIIAGLYTDGKGTAENLNNGYSEEPVYIRRKVSGSKSLPNAALSIFIAAQPDVIRDAISDKKLRSIGFISRFLFAFPPSRVGERETDLDLIPEIPEEIQNDWDNLILDLLNLPGDLWLRLSPEAKQVYQKWWGGWEKRLHKEKGDLYSADDWGGKHHGRVLRIALLLHCMENVERNAETGKPYLYSNEIQASTLQSALEIAEYYERHTLLAFMQSANEGDIRKRALAVLHWMKDAAGSFPASGKFTRVAAFAALQREMEGKIEKLNEALWLLQDLGWVRSVSSSYAATGKKIETLEAHPAALQMRSLPAPTAPPSLSPLDEGESDERLWEEAFSRAGKSDSFQGESFKAKQLQQVAFPWEEDVEKRGEAMRTWPKELRGCKSQKYLITLIGVALARGAGKGSLDAGKHKITKCGEGKGSGSYSLQKTEFPIELPRVSTECPPSGVHRALDQFRTGDDAQPKKWVDTTPLDTPQSVSERVEREREREREAIFILPIGGEGVVSTYPQVSEGNPVSDREIDRVDTTRWTLGGHSEKQEEFVLEKSQEPIIGVGEVISLPSQVEVDQKMRELVLSVTSVERLGTARWQAWRSALRKEELKQAERPPHPWELPVELEAFKAFDAKGYDKMRKQVQEELGCC